MSSYLSSLVSTTTSRYNSLRRTLLSDEADGDTEDDTHICRVLRAYYTEKGRPFPPWLPPDPKASQPYPSASYGKTSGPQRGSGGIGLSDLWESPQQPPAEESTTLRRAGQGRALGKGLPARPRNTDSYNNRVAGLQSESAGRPLPSQRVGSYQTQFPQQQSSRNESSPSPVPSSSSGTSAQERLKARLLGAARAASPTQSGGPQSPPISHVGSSNPYATGGGYAGYDASTRSGSGYGTNGNPYDGQGSAGGVRSASDQTPSVSATAPWSSSGEGRGSPASHDPPLSKGIGRWAAGGKLGGLGRR